MTQIGTTREQSKRLLDAGVKPETADMTWMTVKSPNPEGRDYVLMVGRYLKYNNPPTMAAWSLSRLLSLLPMEIRKDGIDFAMMLKSYPNEEECYRWDLEYFDSELEATAYYSEAPDPIEACVRMVKKLTHNGYKLNEIEQ